LHGHGLQTGRDPARGRSLPTAGLGRSLERGKILRDFPCRSHTTVVVGGCFNESEVVLATNVGPSRAWEDDDRQLTEDRVDGGATESELTQVRACEERAGRLKQGGGRRYAVHDFSWRVAGAVASRSATGSGVLWIRR
jgi:hypothetical protein